MARGTRHGHRSGHIRNLAAMQLWRSGRGSLAVLCSAMLVLAGCAQFNDIQSQPFTTEPERHPPASSSPPPPPPLPDKPFPKKCPAPGTMQGCLESTSGLLMQPDSKSALVAERITGAVKEVSVSAEPKVKTVIPVDPAGDGGLMDIVLSPTYKQDRLMYAYISTPTDNRVVRVADGDTPKDILTGIPKGGIGNTGALLFTSPTTLVVLTGDAGNPAMANDPASLAGKVIRLEQPTTLHPSPPTTALSGIGAGGGLCTDPVDGSLFVLDRAPTAANHQRLQGFHRVDLARPTGRGRLLGVGRHRAGQPGQHQADGGRPPGAGHRRGHRPTRRGSPGHTRTCLGAADVAGRQRVGRDGQQNRGGRHETRRRGVPAVPAGRRLPAGQRRQDLTTQ